MSRARSILLTLLAASVAWFVALGSPVPRFSASTGSQRFERDHDTVTTVVTAVRTLESVKEIAREPFALPVVAPAREVRLPIEEIVLPPAPRRSRAFSMVFLI